MTAKTLSKIRTTINGFLCEIEPNEDREGVNCYVSKGRFSASLACLEGEGILSADGNSYGEDIELDVPQTTINQIVSWAVGKGY